MNTITKNNDLKEEINTDYPKVYACMANSDIRLKSSSGGAFKLISDYVLSNNGYIVGAAFNDSWEVEHIITNTPQGLERIQGSKYVRSKITKELLQNIQKLLEDDNYVLFSGCPCQVEGLKKFLGKDYEKLLLIDIFCTYAPSAKFFKGFLKDELGGSEGIEKINFRDKETLGWNCSAVAITKNSQKKIYYTYQKCYHAKIMMGKECENCRFATLSRVGDITLADFWGIEKYDKNLTDCLGTSLVMLNNNKGEKIFDIIKNSNLISKIAPVPLKYAMQRACYKQFEVNPKRDRFFKIFEKEGFKSAYEKTLGNKKEKIGILNFWYVPNRGAILTNYALNEFLKEQNYDPYTVNYYPTEEKSLHKNSISEKFAKQYLKTTKYCLNYLDLKEINQDIKTFLVGSDQVFRGWCNTPHNDKYFLNFADDDSKKIACSASFGLPYYDGDENSKIIMKKYLKRFDVISTRETNGIEILKNDFDIDAIQIMDPVFYIDKGKYEALLKTSKKNDKDFLAYYIVGEITPEYQKAISYSAEKLGVSNIIDIKQDLPVEDWLYYIKNSKYFICNSFHGTCFAIIFGKPFFVISPLDKMSDPRLDTILEITGIQDRQLIYPTEIYSKDFLLTTEPEFNYLNIEKETARSKKWLVEQIESEKQIKTYSEQDKLFYAIMEKIYTQDAYHQRIEILINNKLKFKLYCIKYFILKFFASKAECRNKYNKKYQYYKSELKFLKLMK